MPANLSTDKSVIEAEEPQQSNHSTVKAEPSAAKPIYTCPMHPEVQQDHPGECPKCGMSLEPVTPAPAAKIEYTCPMHPQIVRSEPGTCPICGMTLESRTLAPESEGNAELASMRRRAKVCTSSVAHNPFFRRPIDILHQKIMSDR